MPVTDSLFPSNSNEIFVDGNWQDHIGTVVAERYTLRTLVYAGRRQAEFLAVTPDQDQKPVSLAVIAPDPDEISPELAAIDRAKELQHPNLLHVLDGGECSWDGAQVLFIVTEAAEGTLAEALAEIQAKPSTLLNDLLPALEWLHGQGLVYRNLHQDTIVRAGGRWKLADLSRLHAIGQFDACEEMQRDTPPEAASGWILPAWDIWGLGVLLQDVLAPEGLPLPAPFASIVRGCLEPDYTKRLSLQGIKTLLEPEPVSPELVTPEAPREEVAPRPSRVPIAIPAVALILGGLAIGWWLWPRSSTPPVAPMASHTAPRVVSQPARPASSPAVPPAAPKVSVAPPVQAKPSAPVEPVGRADYFSDDLEGHPTANGEVFSNQAMTAASQEFALGTRLRVTNLKNGHSAVVRVNDRGVTRRGFIIRVTRTVAEQLGFVNAGWAKVKLQVVK
jgi:rare lipoprotein A